MMDYVKAAFYTALLVAGITGLATAISTFPTESLYVILAASLGLMFYSILFAIRSQRTINQIRARYE